MTDYSIILDTPAARQKAMRAVERAPAGYQAVFSEPPPKPKTRPQENKFHAMVRDIAKQVKHNGQSYDESEWKKLFCDALRRETKVVPSLDGSGFVDLGWASTSRLTERQYSDLILIVTAYGDTHGVKFKADKGIEEMMR